MADREKKAIALGTELQDTLMKIQNSSDLEKVKKQKREQAMEDYQTKITALYQQKSN